MTPKDEYERITTQLPRPLVKKLRQQAKENDRSVAAEIRMAVTNWLNDGKP